jgi:hypothetical protein
VIDHNKEITSVSSPEILIQYVNVGHGLGIKILLSTLGDFACASVVTSS